MAHPQVLEAVCLTANMQLSGNKVVFGIPTASLSLLNGVLLVCCFEMVNEEMGKLREQNRGAPRMSIMRGNRYLLLIPLFLL